MGDSEAAAAAAASSSSPASGSGSGSSQSKSGKKNHNKYRRDKPWDNDSIDHWKVEEWKPEYMPGSLLEESKFATLFPQYREAYLREVWPVVCRELEKFKVKAKLNLVEGSMTVFTTKATWDPYAIIKGRDLVGSLGCIGVGVGVGGCGVAGVAERKGRGGEGGEGGEEREKREKRKKREKR